MATATEAAKQPKSVEPAASKSVQGERDLLEMGALPPETVLTRLATTEKGLSDEAVAERLERYGHNEVERARKLGFLGEIWTRCKNPLVIQLLVIAIISYAMGDLIARPLWWGSWSS